MPLHVKEVLSAEKMREGRAILTRATWGDGGVAAGVQSAQAKSHAQLPQDSAETRALQQIVLGGLNRHALFSRPRCPSACSRRCSTASPATRTRSAAMSTTRCASSWAGERVRTDLSCTLFLAGPDEYDGGELVVEDTCGAPRIKLPAGDVVLYPGTRVHNDEPATRGARLASFFGSRAGCAATNRAACCSRWTPT